jgi:GrpB-like predicted nucleotidyltransferase (UPF0157 family)
VRWRHGGTARGADLAGRGDKGMSEPIAHVEIVIVDYDPRWPLLYAEERGRVEAVLDGMLKSIEHIGSTSVPGLAAKPIIDLLVTVPHLDAVDPYLWPLGSLGYTFFARLGNKDRHMFGRGRPHTHHLHIVEHDGEEHYRPLAFRNYLRSHCETAHEYAALKRVLAERFHHNRQAYNEAKTTFIRSIEARARD